ncbi:uncharacterized protein LOC129912633 [Episyrphus balteatus]|uniref:uncharacterized protein LOC129912633 n=1 Tax=Episyrphus balteatus TaxID=286459 RepID=UPI0024862861|nr:uncharacterized protein LOC129912633 [Episyrphus balteatus]
MNSYLPRKYLDMSYPVSIEDSVIMVPVNGFLSPHEYFQRPFSTGVWLCIGFSVVFIAVSKIFLDKIITSKADIWSSFSDTYQILLHLPTEKPITSNYRFYLLVLLFAFIIGNLFRAYFQSFLTVFIKIKQFDTIQDLADKNVSVMISNNVWEILKNESYPDGFDKIIYPVDFFTYATEFVSMRNTNFAYAVDENKCQFYIGFQSMFRKSLFRMAKETIYNHQFGYLLPPNSPFKEILNDFIIEIRQTGLLQKWDSDIFHQAKLLGYASKIYTDYVYEEAHVALTLNQLQFT